MYRPRYPALVKDRVRWVGDYVAFVVAETLNQAKDVAELIEVDFEPLPVVVSTAGASEAGAPLVWDDCPNNICFVSLMGDKKKTDAAFESADHVVSCRLVINRVTAASMEPRGCIGDYNAADDHYTLHTGVQRAFSYRSDLANKVLKVPESKIRIIAGDIGGSFGMKSPIFNETPLVLLASKLIGRPVKWISSRSEAFLNDAQARDNVTDAELALDKDGTFLGVRVKLVAAIGAYLQPGMPNFLNNVNSIAGVYRTPAIHADVTGVFTNTNPVRPYRGNGRPEAGYVIERLVDLAADELGIDPAELRRRNYIPSDAMPYKTALAFIYDSGAFERSMDMALEMADVAGFAKRREDATERGQLRGLGIANTIERAAPPGFEAAEIRFDHGGGVTLYSGSINHGQGHETVFKQIVCDRLGIDPNEVRYIQGDTDKVAMGEGTGGSRTATLGGSAFLGATDKIVAKAKDIAAHILGVGVDDVGTVLNPLLLHGQIHGSVVMGIGQILMENIHFDESGQLLTGSFMDYTMPRASDLCMIETGSNPVPTPTNPLGVKGAGEAGSVGALPAVANALVDALSQFGIRHIEMPATPECVWRTIQEATVRH